MTAGRHPVATVGTGTLISVDGRVLLEQARYLIAVRSGGAPDRTDTIEGRILNPPEPWGFAGSAIGRPAVLQLSSGDHWECMVVSHSGTLLNRGRRGLFRAEK
jgi:hypothetical protein